MSDINLPVINWTPKMLERFKIVYVNLPDGVNEFVFDGYTFAKAYAKYLIEYLEGRLRGRL